MRNNLLRNAYTNAPERNSNLILGSLQLFFWLVFRPTAWRNHLKRIETTLGRSLISSIKQIRWGNAALWQLIIQGYFILPFLANLLLRLLLWVCGEQIASIAFYIAIGVVLGLAVFVLIVVVVDVVVGVLGGMVVRPATDVVTLTRRNRTRVTAFYDMVIPIATALVIGVAVSFVVGRVVNTATGLLIGVVVFLLAINMEEEEGTAAVYNVVRVIAVPIGLMAGIAIGVFAGWPGVLLGAWVGAWAGELVGRMARSVAVAVHMAVRTAVEVIVRVVFGLWMMTRVMVCLVIGVAVGVVVSVAYGMVAVGIVAYGLVAVGVGVDLAVGLVAVGVGVGWSVGLVAVGVGGSLAAHLVVGFADGLVAGLVAGLTADLATGLVVGVAAAMGITINSWRPILLLPFIAVWNYLLYLLEKRRKARSPCLLRYHSAFWDEWQRLHLPGLDEHLLFVLENNLFEGNAASQYLSKSSQRWAIQSAQIKLDIQKLKRCNDIEAICQIHRSLSGVLESPIKDLISIFIKISKDVDAALKQTSIYNQRKILSDVAERLKPKLQEINRSSNQYAPLFYPIAESWLQIIANHIEELVEATELRQEIESPYIAGNPLRLEQEIFTGRTTIGIRIEKLLLDPRRPPLLLYGQRRMGKTSLLNNIGKLLPNSIIPMFVDLQGAPSSASNYTGFLYNLARGMIKSAKEQGALILPSLTREELKDDPFTRFDEWLDQVEQILAQNTALLMLDEFEALDSAITKGRFDEQDILGMLRHLIQHRPRFKMLLAGSHTIEEYQRWASYLINVQVVHISYLKEEEARQLIEHPVKDFTLRYEPDAVERVLQLTRCHPFLVQLLCGEIIVLKNEQDPSIRRLATLADVEAAVPEALQSSSFFFADIQNNQIDDNGRDILRFIAAQGEGAIVSKLNLSQQFPDVWEITIKLLLQREFIEEVAGGYRFQVELIRLWFQQPS